MVRGRILIADNESEHIDQMCRILEENGYQTFWAHDGLDAVDIAIREQPDLMLLALMLPAISGYDVLRRLKKHPNARNIDIVCMTSLWSIDTEMRVRHQGGKALLTKSLAPENVLDTVREYISDALIG